MVSTVKVLTLNCWALPFPNASQHKEERVKAIGHELSKGEYDLVILQEVWKVSDYDELCKTVLKSFPYSHYFHSGVIGSGVCVFSKHSILETLQHRFSLNGYAHKLHHFDWYGSKMVGLCRVLFDKKIKINVYATHLHAFYHHPKDEYKAHRLVQAFEMSQFIKHTSETCDIVIAAGDLNTRPEELGYSVLTSNGNLHDAWLTQKVKPAADDIGATSDRPDNPFRGQSLDKEFPQGYRLDYILYRANAGYNMDCDKCYLTMGKIPEKNFNYSDHEGVAAVFRINKNLTAMGNPRNMGDIEKNIIDSLPIVEDGINSVKASRVFYFSLLVLCLAALTYLATVQASSIFYVFVNILYIVVFCVVIFAAWNAVVLVTVEHNNLVAARKDMNSLLRANPVN